MQTDTHIELISPNRCYDCSRHTGMNFYNYESLCQMMVNPMPVTSLLFGVAKEFLHTLVIAVFKFRHSTTT